MSFIKWSVLSTCMVLAACDEKFARLQFQHAGQISSPDNALQLQQQFSDSVSEALSKLGVGADEIEVLPHQWATDQVYLNIRNRSLSASKRVAIKDYLRGIEQARQIPISISWRALVTRSDGWGASAIAFKYGQGSATVSSMMLEAGTPTQLSTSSKPDAPHQCYFLSSLNGPFRPYVQSLIINADSPFSNNEPGNSTLAFSQGGLDFETPAQLTITNDVLVDLLNRRRVTLHFKSHMVTAQRLLDARFVSVPTLRQVYIMFSPLQGTDIRERKGNATPLQICEEAAMSFGRPFTFHAGISMDRLQKATFLDE